MPSRNVALRKDVYDALRKEMRPSESFTKLIVRLMSQKGPLRQLHGAWPKGRGARDAKEWRRLRGLRPSEGR
ncbi:MAG TPA: antitoxin VapB family protein [Thermoplasmata archaeon]|nr:antitoxin VapB family protein [Thermoplasmata archaeon]